MKIGMKPHFTGLVNFSNQYESVTLNTNQILTAAPTGLTNQCTKVQFIPRGAQDKAQELVIQFDYDNFTKTIEKAQK